MLPDVPRHLRQEARALEACGIDSWAALSRLDDGALARAVRLHGADIRRLRRLRGQALLMQGTGLAVHEAAALLYAGIADVKGLATSQPEQLHRHIGRLTRALGGRAIPSPSLATVQRWVVAARRCRG